MGVATATAISLGLATVGTGMSVYQGIQGSKAEAKANEAAATAAQDAKRIAEVDRYASLQVPTLGLELAQQNIQARQAATIQGLQEGGAATVLGGLTAANQQAQAQDLQLAAQANQMQAQRDQMQAQNAQQIESDRIARQAGLINAQLGGAQAAASEARQNKQQGQLGAIQGLSSAAQLYAYQDIYGNKNVKQQAPGSNATTLVDIQRTAQDAFKPQISAMRPQNVQMNNPALNQMQANNLSSIPGSGVQALTPMDLMSAPNSPYNWMYGNVTTGQ
jgi:hypothetical protein